LKQLQSVHHEDLDSHIHAVEEDMEYWRTKRLEPRIIRLIRKGTIAFPDLIEASEAARSRLEKQESGSGLEDRVAALEIGLGGFVRGIQVATSIIGDLVLIDESREEAGIYDDNAKLAHRKFGGRATERVGQLEEALSGNMLVLQALLVVLAKKGLVTLEKVDEMLAAPNPPRFENGARIVAKAWLDPEFRTRLLGDAKTTLRELGFALNRAPKLVVLEDTRSVRHVIVCTLCSCYPYQLLGNPPWWYKQDRYKQEIIASPRKMLEEMFELKVPPTVEVRVYDSTSDIRYMVLPNRPAGTEGMSEDQLARLVTQNSLIGVGDPLKAKVEEAKIIQD
jgi:nitrile hydratase subunit alpha